MHDTTVADQFSLFTPNTLRLSEYAQAHRCSNVSTIWDACDFYRINLELVESLDWKDINVLFFKSPNLSLVALKQVILYITLNSMGFLR